MHVRRTFVVALGRDAVSEFTVDDSGMTLHLADDGARQLHTRLGEMLTPEPAEDAISSDEERTREYIQKRTLRDWHITGTSDPDLCATATRDYAPGARQLVPSVYELRQKDLPLGAQLCEELLRAAFWLQPRVRDCSYNGEVVVWSLRSVRVVVGNALRVHYVLVCCTHGMGIRLADHLDVAAIHAGAGVFIPKFN